MIARRLKNLFGSRGDDAAAPAGAHVPPGERLYAIGDVHGRLDLLTNLLDAIDRDDAARGPADTRVILLGDLVDRGPQSKQVIDHLLTRDWGTRRPVFLKGNHEEVFLLTLAGNLEAARFWVRIGGAETMASYGVSASLIESGEMLSVCEDFARRVPDAHAMFLNRMIDSLVVGGYCFVHAGIKPGVPLDRQKPEDLRWIRERFLDFEGSHGAIVVHGHSISPAVEELHNRIGIDTGAYASGTLTAIGIESGHRWFLAT
ncbi:MAG: metallophosphoesterase family protein [Sphingomonas sp.]|uniref:metallophosphoesterase family protein n=1 Tax=Sphingomonas sp. TaxID=28214 RepID=UPI003F7DEF39